MKLIESSAEIILESNPLKKIEMAGRTCYKSEKNITDESAAKFVRTLVKNEHYAMIEHAVFTFKMPIPVEWNYVETDNYKYFTTDIVANEMIVTANLRAIHENNNFIANACKAIIEKELPEIFEILGWEKSTKYYEGKLIDPNTLQDELLPRHKHITMKFICDRGVTHELVRHRPCSFAQESTRYCNYAKSDELVFIKPYNFDNEPENKQKHYIETLENSEKAYLKAINNGDQPQQARALLPNAIKTEIIVTASLVEWAHIMNLRYHGTTGKPHPDMKELMTKAYPLYESQF